MEKKWHAEGDVTLRNNTYERITRAGKKDHSKYSPVIESCVWMEGFADGAPNSTSQSVMHESEKDLRLSPHFCLPEVRDLWPLLLS